MKTRWKCQWWWRIRRKIKKKKAGEIDRNGWNKKTENSNKEIRGSNGA